MVALKLGSAVCSALTEAAAATSESSGHSSRRGLLLGVPGEAALAVLWLQQQQQQLVPIGKDELKVVRERPVS